MWLFDAFTSGFATPTAESRIQYVRMLLGAACLAKVVLAAVHQGWNRLALGGYTHHVLSARLGAERAALVCRAYRPALVVRSVAAVFLGVGVLPKAAAAVTLIGLLFELVYEYRYNTIYLALMVACLLVAGDLGTGLVVQESRTAANTWAQFLVVLVTIDIYWNSAWQKARSHHFMSGLLLAQFVEAGGAVQGRLPYREYYYPGVVLRRLGCTPAGIRAWKWMARGTVALELAIPFGLLIPPLWGVTFVLGAVMHVAFAWLKPRGIVGFSIASIASYIAFLP